MTDSGTNVQIIVSDKKGKPQEQAIIDQGQLNTWLASKNFMKGMDNKKKDYKKFTKCGYFGSPSLTGAEIKLAFQQAAMDPNTNSGDLQKALQGYNDAIKEFGKGNPKKAGEKLAGALKDLAKSVGC